MPSHFDNPLIELLIKVKRAEIDRERTIDIRSALRLLLHPDVVADLLRGRSPDGELALTVRERALLSLIASGRRSIRQTWSRLMNRSGETERAQYIEGSMRRYRRPRCEFYMKVNDRITHLFSTAKSQIEVEVRRTEAEAYVAAGGSFMDFGCDKPLTAFVFERIEAELAKRTDRSTGDRRSPGLDDRLDRFIVRCLEGRAARFERVQLELDQLVRDGFADEFLRDVWNRYPVEAARLDSPMPAAKGEGEGIARSRDPAERAPEKELPPARHSPSGGMSWQDAKDKAERHVKRKGFPGVNALAKIVGCSSSTMSKAISRSTNLKARKAEHEAERKGKPREVQMTDVRYDDLEQTTETDPACDEAATLQELIDEQKADDDGPHPLGTRARRRSR